MSEPALAPGAITSMPGCCTMLWRSWMPESRWNSTEPVTTLSAIVACSSDRASDDAPGRSVASGPARSFAAINEFETKATASPCSSTSGPLAFARIVVRRMIRLWASPATISAPSVRCPIGFSLTFPAISLQRTPAAHRTPGAVAPQPTEFKYTPPDTVAFPGPWLATTAPRGARLPSMMKSNAHRNVGSSRSGKISLKELRNAAPPASRARLFAIRTGRSGSFV